MNCPLCLPLANIIFENEQLVIIVVLDDPNAPAFCRVIWRDHVKEMSDLSSLEQQQLMNWVIKLEAAMCKVLNPTKMNLASFGNQVPHIHWHVIARFEEDNCFPDSIWATPKRDTENVVLPEGWIQKVQLELNS